MPDTLTERAPSFTLARRKPVEPGAAEISANPRVALGAAARRRRLDAPAWPLDPAALGLPMPKAGEMRVRNYRTFTNPC